MNKTQILLILLLLCRLPLSAQKWNWVQKIEGEKCESGMGIAVTPDNHIMLAGIYEDTGGAEFESAGEEPSRYEANADTFPQSHSTLFLAKYAMDGKLIWKTNAFAANGITPWNLHVDKKGNSIVCGNFRGLAIFHSVKGKEKTVIGTPSERAEGAPLNYYVAKYNSEGNLQWVKVARSSDHSVAFEAETDSAYNVYVRAYCHYGSIAFDDYSLFPRSDSGRYTGNYSLIVVKYDPDGNEQWITRGGNFSIRQMDVTPAGEVELYGSYQDKAILYSTSGKKYFPEKLAYTAFANAIIRLDKNGELQSITKGFTDAPALDLHKAIRDKQGNYFLQLFNYEPTSMSQEVVLKIGERKLKAKFQDTFIARYTPQRKLVWIVQVSGGSSEKPLDIVMDENNNLVISGHFNRNVTLYDQFGDSLCLKSDYQTMYIASYSSEGALLFAETCGSLFSGYGEQLKLVVAPGNKLFLTGQINMPSQIGPRGLDVKGEKGWVSPSWERKIDYGHYSDAFIGCMSLNEKPDQGSLVFNLQLNLEEAARMLEEQMARLSKVMDDAHLYVQFEQEQSFAPANGEPLTYHQPGSIEPLVYPNPAGYGQPEVTVQFELNAAATVKWSLQTQNGALIQSEVLHFDSGIASFRFSVSHLSAGIYNLIIESGKNRVVKKLVVQ